MDYFHIVLWLIVALVLVTGLVCFSIGWVLLHWQRETKEVRPVNNKANAFMAIGIVLIAVAFMFLIITVDWPMNVKIGIVFAGSALPLLVAALYSRASILYEHKEEPIAMFLGLLGILIAVLGGEAIFNPLFPQWFSILYGTGVLFLVALVLCVLQMRWERLRRQRRSLETLDPETILKDEKEAAEQQSTLKKLLLVGGCLCIAASVPVILFYQGISWIWVVVVVSCLSVVLIFWGEYNLRAYLLYGYKKRPGAGWAVFLGVTLVFFYVIIYMLPALGSHSSDIVFGLFFWGVWMGQARLSRRWNRLGEQQRQIVRPGTDLNDLIEQVAKTSE